MTPKLYTSAGKNNFRTQKVLISAKFSGKELEIVEQFPPKGRFPLGLSPALEANGVSLFHEDAISRYFIGYNSSYWPNNPEVEQWLQWAASELLPNVFAYLLPSISLAQINVDVLEQNKNELFAQLRLFNDILLSKTFLVGERLTIADVSVALNLLEAYKHVFDEPTRKEFVNVTRWFNTVLHNPTVKEVLGEIHFASKCSIFDRNFHAFIEAQPFYHTCFIGKIYEENVRVLGLKSQDVQSGSQKREEVVYL